MKLLKILALQIPQIRSLYEENKKLREELGLEGLTKKRQQIIDIGQKNAENRDKWVIQSLQALTTGDKLLDIGAGEQRYKQYCQHLDYTS